MPVSHDAAPLFAGWEKAMILVLSPGAHGHRCVTEGRACRRRAPCAPSEISAFSPAGRTRPLVRQADRPHAGPPDRGLGPRDPDGVGPPCRPLHSAMPSVKGPGGA